MDRIIDLSASSGNEDSVDLLANLAEDERKGATVTRVIMDLRYTLAGIGSVQDISIGLTLVNDDALASGALPDPQAETDQPGWLWRTTHEIAEPDNPNLRQHHDLRAQRKMEEEETLVLIIFVAAVNVMTVHGMSRVLMRRHP